MGGAAQGSGRYRIKDLDQYHNNEDNKQAPYVAYAKDTTTQDVNFRVNLLKGEDCCEGCDCGDKDGKEGHGKGDKDGKKDDGNYFVYDENTGKGKAY